MASGPSAVELPMMAMTQATAHRIVIESSTRAASRECECRRRTMVRLAGVCIQRLTSALEAPAPSAKCVVQIAAQGDANASARIGTASMSPIGKAMASILRRSTSLRVTDAR